MELITRLVQIKHGNYYGKANKTFLHRNDKNILVELELVDSIVEIKDGMLISYSVKLPNGNVVDSSDAFIKNGRPYILLREELFDEEGELGEHIIQLKLYDKHNMSRMSIAPFSIFVEESQGTFFNDEDIDNVLLSQEDYKLMTENQLLLEMERAVKITDLDEIEELQGFTIVSDENGTFKYDVSKLASDEEVQEKIDEVKQYIDEKVGEDIDLSQYATYDYVDAQDATKANKVHSHVVADIEDLVIPTKVSELENDAGYITEIPSIYVTEPRLMAELYNKANKSDFNELRAEVQQARNNATNLDTRLDAMERESSTHVKRNEIGNLVQNELDAELPNLVAGEVNNVMGDYVKVNQFNTSMASKANTSDLNATNQNVGILSVKVENINTSLENKASKAELNALANRVATNETDIDNLEQDVTVIETEIRNIRNNMGEQNVQANWIETDTTSDAYIKNKPNLNVYATKTETGNLANLQTTSKASLVSAINEVKAIAEQPTGEDNVQADWLQTDTGADSYIKNKPVIPTSVEQLQGIDKYALETSLQELVKEVVEARAMSPYVFANLKDRLDAMSGGMGVDVDLSDYYTKEQTVTKILEMLLDAQFLEYKLVDALPLVGEKNIVYLLKQNDSNSCIQYMYLDDTWQILGTTEIDLSNYYTKQETYSKEEMDDTLGTVTLTTTAQTVKGAINELDLVNDEVIQARTDYHDVIHGNLKARLDADRKEVVDARTDVDGNVHENLQLHIHAIETNIDEIEEVIGEEEELATEAKIIVDAINELHDRIRELNTGGNGCPVGSILPYAGDGLVPNGFVVCRGQEVSREDYAELFEVIGTTYGAGDGATTFKLPDLQGRVPVGQTYDVSYTSEDGLALFSYKGNKGGKISQSIQLKHLPAHTHELQDKTHYHDGSYGEDSANSFTETNWVSTNGNTYNYYLPMKTSTWNADEGSNVSGSGDYYLKSDDTNFSTIYMAHKHKVKGATIRNWRTKHSVLNSSYQTVTKEKLMTVQPYLTVDYIICYTKVTKFSSEILKWLPQTDYERGMMVYINGQIYKSLVDHKSSDDFSTDEEDKWEVIVSGGDALARELEEEIIKARKDIDGVEYETLGEHLDAIETNFDTVIGDMTTLTTDEKTTIVGAINEIHTDLQEVVDARTDAENNEFDNLKLRLDNDKQEVIDARMDAKDFVYATLGERLNEMDKNIEQNAKDIEEIEKQIGDITTLTTTNTDNLVGAINSIDAELDYARVDIDGVVYTTFGERINQLETDTKECEKIHELIGDTSIALETTEQTIIGAINELKDIANAGGGELNVQSDWNITNEDSDAFIKNKPTIPSKTSELQNDSGLVSSPIVTRIELVQALPPVEEDGVLYLVIQD